MQPPDLSSAYRVEDSAQIAALSNPLRCRLLIACVLEERSLSQLRDKIGLPFPKLHYHVGRLLDAGLLAVSRSQPRAGRAITYYRAIAERFLVPDASHRALPGEAWAGELRQLLTEEIERNGECSLLYQPDPEGGMTVRLVRPPQPRPARTFEMWRVLRLNPERKLAFAKELMDLFERYSNAGTDQDAEALLTHAAFAPRKQV